MARQLRVEFDGALYHVTVRGVDRQRLFRTDGDRLRLLDKLEEGVERFELDVFLYCWMSNHIHLLVGTPRGNLGRFMGWWQTAYTVYFNRKYNRKGHLTQGRYGAKLVEGDEYLLGLSRYIHLNPVRIASLKKAPIEERIAALRAYRWSSYPGYCSMRKAKAFVRYPPLLELVAQGRKNQRQAYRSFVETGLGVGEDEWKALQMTSRLAIGSPAFIETIEGLYAKLVEGRKRPEDVALRRVGQPRVEPTRVLREVADAFGVGVADVKRRRPGTWERAVAARFLVQCSGLSQREAAETLGMTTGAAVSQQLRRLRDAMRDERRLRKVMERLLNRLVS